MIKKFEVFNTDTNKLKYIIQCYDNLKDAYEK